MANEKTTEGKEFFVLVPKVGGPVMNLEIIASQRVARIENGVQVEAPKTDILRPSGYGLFIIDKSHAEYETRKTALLNYMKNNNHEGASPVMIGPFNSQEAAFKEMDKVRPKTDAEVAAIEKSKVYVLEAEMNAKDAELAEVKTKLAAAMKKTVNS